MLLRRVFPPTAAQRLIKVDQIEQPRVLRLNEILPRIVKVLLGGEHVQIIVHALTETRFGQFVTPLLGFDEGFPGVKLHFDRGPHCQGVGHFPEGGLNGFFVVCDFDEFAGLAACSSVPRLSPRHENGPAGFAAKSSRPANRGRTDFQACELAVPAEPVRVMVGKNAARAAPMLALAALSWCSASRISGRRCNRSDGSPVGRSDKQSAGLNGDGGVRSSGKGRPTRNTRLCSASANCCS